jgi:hypothetical protein
VHLLRLDFKRSAGLFDRPLALMDDLLQQRSVLRRSHEFTVRQTDGAKPGSARRWQPNVRQMSGRRQTVSLATGHEMAPVTAFTAKWQPDGSRVSDVVHGAVLSHSVKLLIDRDRFFVVTG